MRKRTQIRKFVIGKGSPSTLHGLSKAKYRKNLEASLVISLMVSLLFFRFTTHIDIEKYLIEEESITLEFLDLQDLPPVTEQTQQLKMEQVVEVEPEESETVGEGGEIQEIIDEIEELLAEDEETQLALANDDMGHLISDSPLDLGRHSQLDIRKSLASNDGGIKFRRGKGALAKSSSSLDIGTSRAAPREVGADQANLDLQLAKEKPQKPKKKKYREKQPTLGLSGAPERVLSFASSTFGTEGYKLWNKIISELDRLNKGRYGTVVQEIKRHKKGFVVQFSYDDKTHQEVHWRNDGNVWITVIGKSNKSTIQELRRALHGLLRLSL
ncbi:MAG: hypothetical protein ACE5IY_03575 [bacterium]